MMPKAVPSSRTRRAVLRSLRSSRKKSAQSRKNADELPYSAKAGAFFLPRLGTFVALRGWKSRGDFRGLDPTYELVAADSEQLAAAAEVYFRVTSRVDVNATWSRAIRGRNSAIGNEWSIGIAAHR